MWSLNLPLGVIGHERRSNGRICDNVAASSLRLSSALAHRNYQNPRMPSTLRIPPRYLPGLKAIAELSDEATKDLQAALVNVPRSLTTERLAEHVAKAVPHISDKALETTEALLSLTTLLPEDGSGAPDLAKDVAHSEDLELADKKRDPFAVRLVTLLNLECLWLAARAYDIVTEYERVFHDARILTDMRPVFGPDISQGPKAALLISTLKIDFHPPDGSLNSHFFALDYADLLRLRDAVERAISKHKSLQAMIKQTDIPYWEYREARDATAN